MPSAPFGYRYEGSDIVEEESEQRIIRLILKRRRKKPKPMSYGVIAAELNREGVTNRGKYWNPTTLWYIVKRQT